MKPVVLETPRLWLDCPTPADRALVVEYCQDPLFENYLTLPWPYRGRHADYYLGVLVPNGWAVDSEYIWALRHAEGGPLLGVIGLRTVSYDIGFWIGAPYRGNGYMTEAARAVTGWAFSTGVESLDWECVAGNTASASVARKVGFRYTGERPSTLKYRDGTHPTSWHGTLRADDNGSEQPGWPGASESRSESAIPVPVAVAGPGQVAVAVGGVTENEGESR
jgi:RimJ/RimL family protein N-acetyltransferase